MTGPSLPSGGSRDESPAGEGRPAPLASDALLPPVEPPSGKFLLQLFVIPAVIVAVVVGVWLLINTVVNRGARDPQTLVRALRGSHQARFQKAMELADMLRMEQQYPQLKDNAELAQALAELLDEMRERGETAESAVTMRWIVCGALGQFRVDAGIDALVRAAQSDPERDVRRKAVTSIATLAQNLSEKSPPQALQHPQLADLLVRLANQPEDDVLRSETAFALGVLAAAPEADARYDAELEGMLEDLYPDARYNAAAALARQGDLRAAPTVAEMLDLQAIAASVQGERPFNDQVTPESLARQRSEKRDLIVVNALKAVDALRQRHGAEQLGALSEAVRQFLAAAPAVVEPAPIPQSLIAAAEQVQARLEAAPST